MRITKTLTAVTLAAVIMSSGMTVGAYAYEPETAGTVQEYTAEFAVLTWKKNADDTVTITGCVPYVSPYLKDYPTANVKAVFICNGVLNIPDAIDGMTVTAVKGTNLGKNLKLRYVKVSENVADISDKAFADDVYIVTSES